MKTKKIFGLILMLLLGLGAVSAQTDLKLAARSSRMDHRQLSEKETGMDITAGKMQWVLSETRPIKSADSAKITLKVEIEWPDGEGYQLLLDADATAYGSAIPASQGWFANGDIDESVYNQFEFRIPSDATGGIFDETSLPFRGEASIMVPAGDYDYVLINPDYNYEIWWVAGGKDGIGKADDRHFYAGVEYVFVVTYTTAIDGDTVLLSPSVGLDLAVDYLVSPVSATRFSATEPVSVSVFNAGEIPSTAFELSYTLGANRPVSERVEQAIKPGETYVHTFAQTLDLTEGESFDLKVEVKADGDAYFDNDVLRTKIRKITPVEPPYFCAFGSEEEMAQWTVIDQNKDGATWYWHDNWGRQRQYACIEKSIDVKGNNDYMVTVKPISLPAGDAYINFEYASLSLSTRPDHLEVLYGRSSNPLTMERLVLLDSLDYTMLNEDFDNLFHNQAIDIEEAGDYFFAFHAFSGPKTARLIVDNVEINAGIYIGKPDLAVEMVELPLSSCNTSLTAPMRIALANYGQTDITGFEIKWRVDDGEEQRQMFENTIPYGNKLTVDIARPLDFAGEGAHTVLVTGVVKSTASGAEETMMDNNSHTARVMLYTPSSVPFATDFAKEEERSDWTTHGRWTWEEGYHAYNADGTYPLYSKCISLESGKIYRLSMNFALGIVYSGLPVDGHMTVKLGKTGTDEKDWKTIWDLVACRGFSEDDATFEIAESGEYSFAIESDAFLYIRAITINEVTGQDVRLNGLAEALPTVLPIDQTKDGLYAVVSVENRGLEPVETKVAVFAGMTELGSAMVKLEKNGDIQDVMVKFACPEVTVGRALRLIFRATLENAAAADPSADNEFQTSIRISPVEMAYDLVTEEMFTDGSVVSASGEVMLGVPFTMYKSQMLNQIELGVSRPEDEYVTLSVYEFDVAKQRLGTKLLEQIVRSGTESGFVSFDIPSVLLESGKTYLLAETSAGSFMVVDRAESGAFYMSDGQKVVKETSFGNIAIRGIFAPSTPNETADGAHVALQLFPNPATDELVIVSESAELQEIEIFRLTGDSVFKTALSNGTAFHFRVADLARGLYLAKVKTSAGTRIMKFVVK